MNKKIFIALGLGLLLLALLAVLYLYFGKPEPREWTPGNAMKAAAPPVLTDSRDVKLLVRAVDYSLSYFKKIDAQKVFRYGPDQFTAQQVRLSLEDFRDKLLKHGLTETFFNYIQENFRFYRSAAEEVLFTGYYEARLQGSLTKKGAYQFPLYKKPGDLVRIDLSSFDIYKKYKGLPRVLKGRLTKNNKVLPYYNRDDIDVKKKLDGKKLEIVWINSLVDVFFLQVQGSGIVELDTGERLRVNYAESNGHVYRSIGALMIRRGFLEREKVSMQSIRKYLDEHPEEVEEIFNFNPSYVFFRKVKEGPIGFLGVPVTAYRSIATDRKLFPRGGLCYIETELPVFDKENNITKWKRHSGFVLNQDTGGAIRSPGRVDLFTGFGSESELTAGHMKQKGTFYFMIKK